MTSAVRVHGHKPLSFGIDETDIQANSIGSPDQNCNLLSCRFESQLAEDIFCNSFAIEKEGVLQYFSKVSGSGVHAPFPD